MEAFVGTAIIPSSNEGGTLSCIKDGKLSKQRETYSYCGDCQREADLKILPKGDSNPPSGSLDHNEVRHRPEHSQVPGQRCRHCENEPGMIRICEPRDYGLEQ